jgi:hypothetical protein
VPVPRWERRWEYNGGAFVDGLTGKDTEDERLPENRKVKWPEGYNEDENCENMETGAPYLYTLLLDNYKHTRLLQILTGSPQDDVKCFMYSTVIEDCPEYEALFYCWGDAVDLNDPS